MRRLPLLLLCSSMLPLGGCCSMARFFCGPDRTPWISVNFDTPERAVSTLLEAIRRDEPQIVYLSLADEYRRRLRLDAAAAQLAWARLREENPGLHVVGYAEVPPPTRLADDGASFELTIEGTRVDVEVVRESLWEIRYRRPDHSLGEDGAVITSWSPYAKVEALDNPDRDLSVLTVTPMRFEHEGVDAVPLEAIEHAALTRRWKVARISVRQPQ
ncbi:MAG: hypothetical protein KDC48_05570 [Planctomycetes bacterium]|nr:hypothetical protein [Planctomycetota bacterium]